MNRLIELEKEILKRKSLKKNGFSNGNNQEHKSMGKSFSSSFSNPAIQKVDFQVPGIVPIIKQAYPDACWAATATMMYSWKDGVSYQPQELMDRMGKTWGDMYRNGKIMSSDLEDQFLKDLGFESVRQFNPTLQTWAQMLKDFGPLSVVMDSPSLGFSVHTTVLIGIKGDGSPKSTVTFIDPGDGKQHQLPYDAFIELYERTAQYPIQIIHWPKGTKSVQQSILTARAFTKKVSGIFNQSEVNGMKTFLMANASNPRGPKNCIDTLNHALSLLLSDRNLPAGTSIQATMGGLVAVGLASQPEIIEFNDKNGNITNGTNRPEKLSKSIYDAMILLSNNDPNWSVFGMSIMDGYHSVLISLDNSDVNNRKAYWSDQWASKGGWKFYNKTDLDNEIATLTQGWWDKVLAEKNVKYKTRLTLWRIFKRVNP